MNADENELDHAIESGLLKLFRRVVSIVVAVILTAGGFYYFNC